MLITHSTFSFASACEGNRSRETLRSWCVCHGEGGWSLSENEDLSPAQANPLRPRYTYLVVVNQPDLVKPVTHGEEMSASTHRATRGDWGGRESKDCRYVPGDPLRCIETEVVKVQSHWGNNNPMNCRMRESERPIVAKKRGNACGAKGPYFSRVSNEVGRTA
jgi:hypothetical protein